MSSNNWHYLFKIIYRAVAYWRGFFLYVTIKLCGGICEGIPRVGKLVTFKYPPHPGIRIGRNCDIGPCSYFDVPKTGILNIGNNVKLTAGVVVSAINEVTIGDNSLIAEWVSIRDAQHLFKLGESINSQGLSKGNIWIGRDVWIGRGSAVFLNAHLEDGCILAANSIVKEKRLSSNKIYVGVPAREIAVRPGDED